MKRFFATCFLFISFTQHTVAQGSSAAELIQQGISLHDKADYTGAIELYKKALLIDSKSSQANYEMASSFFALKNYERTLSCCNKVIAAGSGYEDQAYILKGSAYDLLNKPGEAIKTYKQGLKKYSKNYLLYYNLAYTYYNLKSYKEADEALQKALRINPSHASSHLLLGYSNVMEGNRVKGILALYNFLLLEPTGSRAVSALKLLEEELAKGVKKDNDRSVTITAPGKKDDTDDFYTAELMLGLLEASKTSELNKDKTAAELFFENTHSFFNILGEMKKDKKGFWWNFYVDYFYNLAANKHTEAFCYYITQSKEDIYKEWLKKKEHLKEFDAFSTWHTGYLHKY